MPDPFASRHVACVAEAAEGTYVAARTSTAANAACKAQWMRAAAKPRQRLPVPGPSPLTLWCGVCCACVASHFYSDHEIVTTHSDFAEL